jgi:hypothetical protein
MNVGDLVRFTEAVWASASIKIGAGDVGLIIENTEDGEVIVFIRGWELKGNPAFLEVLNESR